MKSNFIKAVGVVMLSLVFLLSSCKKSGTNSVDGESTSSDNHPSVEISLEEIQHQYSDIDLDSSWNSSEAVKIALSDNNVQIDGSGAKANGSVVTIDTGGTYLLSGTLTDGRIIITASKTNTVRLIMNGVNINSISGSPIYCAQADKLIITLAEGTTNTFSDTANTKYDNVTNEEPDATIFSKCDLTINGKGNMTVHSNFNNGIGTKDDLVISEGKFNIKSVNHGIRGRDSVTIVNGDFTIESGNDGIQSNNDEDTSKGWISIENGSFNITSNNDGIQSETKLIILEGSYTINAGGGSGKSSSSPSNNPFGENSSSSSNTESQKGIKAGGDMLISGGTFNLNCADDTIHSNANIEIQSGTYSLSTGDDGVHSDSTLIIKGGKIEITKSYEGIEGSNITISGGEISIVASDDGINVAGGNDGTASQGGFGRDSFAGGNHLLKISGGVIKVNADGDGLDSNGNVEISGGEIYVDGPTSNGNGALDYDGDFKMTGGTLIAAGSSGMAQTLGADSTQTSLMLYLSNTYQNKKVTIKDASSSEVISYTPSKAFSSIVFCSPKLKVNETYSIYVDGTKLLDYKLTKVTTSISDTGSEVQGGVGGRGGGFMDRERPSPGGQRRN